MAPNTSYCPACYGPQQIATTKPTYSSSPIPGRTSNWRDEVIILCSRRHPTGSVQASSGTREHHSVRVSFILMFLLLCLMAKREISRTFALYSGRFPATHVHVEHSDWLDSVKATSSGRFYYLSARRSRLASLLRNHSSKTVSILNYLTRPARHPRLLRRPLPDQRNVACSIRCPNPCGRRRSGRRPWSTFIFMPRGSPRHVWVGGFKVGRNPICSRFSWRICVGVPK